MPVNKNTVFATEPAAEEALIYPVLKDHAESHDLALEAYEEHHFVNSILKEVEETASDDETWLAKFAVFKENIFHHIKEEEGKLFKFLKKILTRSELEELGNKIKIMKKDYKNNL